MLRPYNPGRMLRPYRPETSGGRAVIGLSDCLRVLWSARFVVRDSSMWPTLGSGDRVLVDRLVYRFRAPRAGEVVVLQHPELADERAVKRVMGTPGQTVSIGPRVWHLGADEYLVLGDNRAASRDSRHFGPIGRRRMLGLVWRRYAPAVRSGPLPPPTDAC